MMYPLLLITIIATLSTLIHALPPLPHLPSPPSNFTNISATADTVCYTTSQDIKPITAVQCEAALHRLRRSLNTQEDRFWSVPLTERFFLSRWTAGSCSIEVVGWTPTAEDWFSLNDVAVRAQKIIRECVERGVHLGGRMEVGPKRVFRIVVMYKDGIPAVA